MSTIIKNKATTKVSKFFYVCYFFIEREGMQAEYAFLDICATRFVAT